MRNIWLLISAIALATVTLTAWPAATPEERHLVVSAEGEVEAVPDVARLSLQVEHTADSVGDAKAAVDRVTSRIIDAARGRGLIDEDIRASQIRVAPDYEWHDGRRELRGQRVERGIDLRLREIDRYSALVADLVDAGVTRIQRASFELSQAEELEREALDKAIAGARRKAESMARAAGTGLQRVYSITENSEGGRPRPMEARTMAVSEDSQDVPMPLGVQTIRTRVTMVFLLE